MTKDLTNSNIYRQNILNNEIALNEIHKAADIKGVLFEDKIAFTKEMVAEFFSVDARTIKRYIAKYSDEFKSNGYELLKGKRLKSFLDIMKKDFGTDMIVGTKITILGIFDFKTFLNIGMVLIDSENARV